MSERLRIRKSQPGFLAVVLLARSIANMAMFTIVDRCCFAHCLSSTSEKLAAIYGQAAQRSRISRARGCRIGGIAVGSELSLVRSGTPRADVALVRRKLPKCFRLPGHRGDDSTPSDASVGGPHASGAPT